jgi:hypothetical protein
VAYFRAREVEQVEEIEFVEEKVTFTPPPELARAVARDAEEPMSREVETP